MQRLLSFGSKYPPLDVRLEFPLGFRAYLPNNLMVRLGIWRYDYTSKQYIFFSAAVKKVERREY